MDLKDPQLCTWPPPTDPFIYHCIKIGSLLRADNTGPGEGLRKLINAELVCGAHYFLSTLYAHQRTDIGSTKAFLQCNEKLQCENKANTHQMKEDAAVQQFYSSKGALELVRKKVVWMT